MAAEWAKRGVRVNCISPGYTRTPLVDRLAHLVPGWLADIPMGRMAETSDLQGAVVYLASDAAAYVDGPRLWWTAGSCSGRVHLSARPGCTIMGLLYRKRMCEVSDPR